MSLRASKNTGRQTAAKEEAYMRAVLEVVPIMQWKRVIEQALTDSLDEDPITRNSGRNFLKSILIGKPQQSPRLPMDEVSSDMSDKTDEELKAIIEQTKKEMSEEQQKRVDALTIEFEQEDSKD